MYKVISMVFGVCGLLIIGMVAMAAIIIDLRDDGVDILAGYPIAE